MQLLWDELWSMHKAASGISRMAKTNSVYRDAMGHAGDVDCMAKHHGVDITRSNSKVDFKLQGSCGQGHCRG